MACVCPVLSVCSPAAPPSSASSAPWRYLDEPFPAAPQQAASLRWHSWALLLLSVLRCGPPDPRSRLVVYLGVLRARAVRKTVPRAVPSPPRQTQACVLRFLPLSREHSAGALRSGPFSLRVLWSALRAVSWRCAPFFTASGVLLRTHVPWATPSLVHGWCCILGGVCCGAKVSGSVVPLGIAKLPSGGSCQFAPAGGEGEGLSPHSLPACVATVCNFADLLGDRGAQLR